MLRIIPITDSGQASRYYTTSDYYTEEQELTGVWRGDGARRLGLSGDIEKADWEKLCDNKAPDGKQLTARQRADRTVAYDFNWHAPKSLSLLYSMSKDERLLDAFRDAVDGTMHGMEAEMATRVRKGGKNEERTTGNMAWGEYIHFTSRPVEAVPDAHLHAHCVVFNATFDEEEQAWKAGQFRELKRDAPYFEAVFHSRLAHRLHELGLPIERTKHGWEISGVGRELVGKFSRRTRQIEDKAKELGIDDAEAKAELGAKTREKKQKSLSFRQLQETWRDRMTPKEVDALAALAWRVGEDPKPADGNASARALDYAMSHVFERKSVVPERTLLAAALKRSVGEATVEQVRRQADASELIKADRKGRRMVTTPQVLDEEQRIIDFARKGRGTCKPFAKGYETFADLELNAGQRQAVKHIVESRDKVMIVRGVAGVGKTRLMKEAAGAIERQGTNVFAFAPTAEASRGVLAAEGFKDADTVARLLVDQRLQRQVKGQLMWIDEAGLLSMKSVSDVFALADRLECRVLLTGDRFQHGAVERAGALRLLEEEAGLVPASVKDIKRQSGSYKQAVKALSEGRVAEGFKRLDELGWIKELQAEERYKQVAADYVETIGRGKEALVVCPTHAEGDRIEAEIRRRLREKGLLGSDERTFEVLHNGGLTEAERGDFIHYAQGDVLVYHQNAKGRKRGDRLEVKADHSLPLHDAGKFQVFHRRRLRLAAGDTVRITRNGMSADGHRLNNGALYGVAGFDDAGNIKLDNGWTIDKGWGFIDQGHVVTSHASQGKTLKHKVLVVQSAESYPASSPEQFYVSVSRARQQAVIYTDSKQELLEAVSKSDERLSATELLKPEPGSSYWPQREPDEERPPVIVPQREPEVIYER